MAYAKDVNSLTTQEIQHLLNENNVLILNILGRQKLEKGCSREQYVEKLADNLNYLAGVAEVHLRKALEDDGYLERSYQQQCMMLDETSKTSGAGNWQSSVVNGSHSSEQQLCCDLKQQLAPSSWDEKQTALITNFARPRSRDASSEMNFIKFL